MTKKQLVKAIENTLYSGMDTTIKSNDIELIVYVKEESGYSCEIAIRNEEYVEVGSATYSKDWRNDDLYDMESYATDALLEAIEDFCNTPNKDEDALAYNWCKNRIKDLIRNAMKVEDGKLTLYTYIDDSEFPDPDNDRIFKRFVWSYAEYGWDFDTAFQYMVHSLVEDLGFEDEDEVWYGECSNEIGISCEDIEDRPEILEALGIEVFETFIAEKEEEQHLAEEQRTGMEPHPMGWTDGEASWGDNSGFGEDYV